MRRRSYLALAALALAVGGGFNASRPTRLSPVKVLSYDPAIFMMDGERVTSGDTGLEKFCVNGSSLAHLERRSTSELYTLQAHYEFCRQDLKSGQFVLDELVRRRDPASQFEMARRLLDTPGKDDEALSLMRAAASQGYGRASRALASYQQTREF